MTLEQILSSSSYFQGLEKNLLADLARTASLKNFRKGEILFAEGDPSRGFYLVASGRVKIFKSAPDGREQLLHLFGPGQPFGGAAVFPGLPSFPAWAEADK